MDVAQVKSFELQAIGGLFLLIVFAGIFVWVSWSDPEVVPEAIISEAHSEPGPEHTVRIKDKTYEVIFLESFLGIDVHDRANTALIAQLQEKILADFSTYDGSVDALRTYTHATTSRAGREQLVLSVDYEKLDTTVFAYVKGYENFMHPSCELCGDGVFAVEASCLGKLHPRYGEGFGYERFNEGGITHGINATATVSCDHSFMDVSIVSNQQIADIEYLLNNRPRKRLGMKTPYEVFYERTGVALQH